MSALTPYMQIGNTLIKNSIDQVLKAQPSTEEEKQYQVSLNKVFEMLDKGRVSSLAAALDDYFENVKAGADLKATHSELQYYLTVVVDGQYSADLRVPDFNYGAKQARARALSLLKEAQEAPAKHLPEYLKQAGKKFEWGVRLYTGGQWYYIEGLNVPAQTRLAHLEYERKRLEKAR